MIREFWLPIVLLAVAAIIAIFVQQWKPSETGRFVLLLILVNLLVIGAFLAWRTQERLVGILTPASEKPMNPLTWGFSGVHPPVGSFKVLLGDSLFVTTDEFHTVLKLAGKDMVRVSIQKRFWPFSPRMMIYARVFDKTGKIVGQIEGDRWKVNPNNYFEKRATAHSIKITDQYGEVFSAEFLNPDCVRILGTFRWAGRSLEARQDGLILPGNNVVSHSYFEGSATDISVQ